MSSLLCKYQLLRQPDAFNFSTHLTNYKTLQTQTVNPDIHHCKGKDEVVLIHDMKAYRGVEVGLNTLNLSTRSKWSSSCPGHFTSEDKAPW